MATAWYGHSIHGYTIFWKRKVVLALFMLSPPFPAPLYCCISSPPTPRRGTNVISSSRKPFLILQLRNSLFSLSSQNLHLHSHKALISRPRDIFLACMPSSAQSLKQPLAQDVKDFLALQGLPIPLPLCPGLF